MDSKNSTSASSSSFGRFKPAIAFVTLVTFIATTLWTPGVSFAAATMSEVNLPYQAVLDTNLRFALPRDIGKIEDLKLGRGPGVVHIQTAHGHYDAQQKIRQILHHLDKHYGIRTLLVEGSAFRLRPELLNFFPRDPKLTAKVADRLTKSAIVKGPELYLLDKVRHPGSAEGYGIEEASAYRANGEAFVEVLTQKEKTSGFLAQMNEGIERLSAPYLNDNLRKFVRTQESFEKKIMPPDAWFTYLKEESSRTLKLELGDPAEQLEWPMITRLFMIRKLQRELDAKKLPKERDSFLKAIRRFIPGAGVCAAVEKILKNDPVSQPLPDPETSLLFEEMTRQLPQDFNYALFPNVRAFIGTLILTSELKAAALMNETGKLTDAVTDKLARTATEKTVISLLKDYRLLQKLFALELTPADYEALLKRTTELTPSVIAKRFEKAVAGSSKRVKDVRFRHTGELDALYASALKFYEGVKARDLAMIGMIEKRLLETGADKVAVVTGGFHSEPFRDYFSSRGYTYALVSPRITDADKAGYEAYINHTLQTVAGRPSPVAGIKPVTSGQSPVTRSTRESPFVSASPAELRAMGVDAEALARAEYRAALPVLAGNPGAARALALQLRAETREDPVREVAGTDALINLIVDNLLKAVSSDRYLILTALGNKTTLAQVGEEFPDVSQEIYETLGGEGFNNEEAEVFFENHHRAIISALARAEARERSTAKPQTRANDLLAALLKAFKRSGDFQAFLRDVQTILKVFFFHETTDGKIYKMQLAGAGVKWVKDIGDMRYEYLNNRLWNLPMRAKLFGDIAVTFIDGKFGIYILSDAPRRLPIVTRTGKSSTVISKKGNKVLTVVGEIPFEDTAMASVLLDPKQTIWNFRKRPDGLHFIVRSTNGTVHLDKVISEERSGSGTELRPRRSTEFGGFLPLVFINSNMIVNALGFLSYAAIAAGAGLFVFAFYSLYRYGGYKKQDNVPEETSPRKRAEARMSDPVYDKDLEAARNLLRREKGNLSVMENNRKLLAANPKAYHPKYREFKQLASLDNQIAARKALIKQLEADVQERETVPARSEWRTGEESPSPIYDEMLLWDLKNGNHGRQREREAWFGRVANEPILRNFLASNLPELLNHQDPWVRDFSRKLLARINAMPRRSEMRENAEAMVAGVAADLRDYIKGDVDFFLDAVGSRTNLTILKDEHSDIADVIAYALREAGLNDKQAESFYTKNHDAILRALEATRSRTRGDRVELPVNPMLAPPERSGAAVFAIHPAFRLMPVDKRAVLPSKGTKAERTRGSAVLDLLKAIAAVGFFIGGIGLMGTLEFEDEVRSESENIEWAKIYGITESQYREFAEEFARDPFAAGDVRSYILGKLGVEVTSATWNGVIEGSGIDESEDAEAVRREVRMRSGLRNVPEKEGVITPGRAEMRGDLPRATDDELRFMKAPDRFMEELKQDPNFRYLGGFDNHETYRPEQAVLKLDGGQELVFLRMMRSHYYTDWGPISPYHFILKNKDDTFSVKQEPASGLGMHLSFTAGGKDARGIPYNRDISVLGLSRAGSKRFVLFAAEESVASILQQFKTVRFSVGQVKGLPVTVEWRAVPEDFWISKEGKRMLARHSAIRGNAQLEGARLGRVAFKDAQGRPDVPFLRRLQSLWEDASRGKHHTDILEALSDILNDFHMMLMAGGNWMMENRIGKLMEGVSEDALFRALALRFATEGPEAMRLFLDQLKGKGSDVSKEILCAYLTGFLTREVRRQLVTPKPAPESQRAELRAGAVKAVETPALPSYIRTVGVDTWQVPVNSLVNAIEMIVRFKQSDLPIEVRTGEFRHYSERGVQLALVSRMTRMIKDRATKAEIRIVKGKLRVRPVGAKPRVEMPGQRSLVSRQELRAGEGIRHGETTVALTRDEIKVEVIRLISEESVVPYQDGDQVGTVLDSVYVSDLELKLEEVYKLPDGYLWNRISVQSTADDIAQTVFDFVDARAIRAGAAGIRAEMRVGATAAEIARGVGLFAGTLRPTGIRGTVRPSQDADFREIQMSQWPETGRKEDASRGAGLVARGVVAFATAAAGASSRQSTDKVPAGALSMIDKLHGKGHKLMSKGATPIGEYGDRVYSYMGLMLTDIGMLLREVSSAVSGASTSKNRVLIMTNANYQEELNEELKRNGFYGIPGEQFVRNQGRIGFQQDLAPKFYLSERDIPKAYATAVKASPEVPIEEHNARRDASIQKAREVEAAIANGHPEAVIHPTERDPAGHAEFFHQMVSKGILLDLIDAGIKYIPFRNIDNAAATYDANFLTLLGWMDRKGYDAIFEVSRRGPGMKGGAWMIGQRGNHRIAEDPSIEATWKRIVADYEKDGWRRQLQIDPATGKGKTPEKLPAGVLSDLEAKIMAGQSIEIEPTDLSYETETIMTVKGLRQLANADKEKEESRIAVFRNAEGDYRLIRKVNSADVVGMNNAVAIYTPKYIADIYRRDATQSFDDFVNEMRDARSKGTLEKLAERGRAKLPLLFDPKPSKDLSVIGLGKAEGNMHEVTGEVSDNVRVRAVGTASLREFDMDRFNALSDYDKAAFMDRVVFRFLATKQWEGPVESWVANLKLYPIIIKRVMEGRRVDIQELRKNGLQGYDGTAGALRAEARISPTLPTTSVAVNAVPANTQDGFGVKDLEPDLRRITMPSFLAFVRHLRFGIFPETVRQAVMEQFRHGTEVLGMLMAKVGISKASAATRAPETALLDKYFTAGQRTELVMSPEDLESNGTFYVSGSFMNRFIREDAGTLFDVLKIYRDKARAAGVKTLLKTSGDAGMFEEMIKALYRKNAVAPKDFRERDEIVAALKSGEILGIHVLAAGQTEVGVVKTLTASLDGKIATLFDDEAVLELLEGGNNFAVTANVGRGDLKLIGRLIVELSSVAELSGDTLLKVLEDIVPNYGKKGTSGFTIGALTIASIAERFVERALIARSA